VGFRILRFLLPDRFSVPRRLDIVMIYVKYAPRSPIGWITAQRGRERRRTGVLEVSE